MNSLDGNWGFVVDKETNSFNGMIGMVQRKVNSSNYVYKFRASELLAFLSINKQGGNHGYGSYYTNKPT